MPKLLATLLLLTCSCATLEQTQPVINGASYHFDRHQSNGRRFNETNVGLGLEAPALGGRIQTGFLVNSFDRTQPYGVYLYDLWGNESRNFGVFGGALYDSGGEGLGPAGGVYATWKPFRLSLLPDVGQEGGGLLFLQIVL